MKSLIYILSLLLTSHIAAQIDWEIKGRFQSGYDSNIYKSPDQIAKPLEPQEPELKDSLEIVNPIKDDIHTAGEIKLDISYKLNKKDRLKLKYKGKLNGYMNYPDRNEHEHSFGLKYRLKPKKKLTLEFKGDLDLAKRFGIDVLGEGDFNVYNYQKYTFKPKLNYRLSKRLELETEYEYRNKDYTRRTPTSPSRSYEEHTAKLGTEFYILPRKKHSIDLEAEFSDRRYSEALMRNKAGKLSSRKLKWIYYKAEMGYILRFRKPSWRWKLYGRFSQRDDPYQNYYSFSEYKLATRIKGRLPEKMEYLVNLGWRYRQYDVRQPAVYHYPLVPSLEWKTLSADLALTKQIFSNTYLTFSYEMDTRDTNEESIARIVQRDYLENRINLQVLFEIGKK